MNRLISLFREPEDPWPSLAERAAEVPSSELPAEAGEPLYFAALMEYLHDRRRIGAATAAHEPREGAD
jgi:hypothetical protein